MYVSVSGISIGTLLRLGNVYFPDAVYILLGGKIGRRLQLSMDDARVQACRQNKLSVINRQGRRRGVAGGNGDKIRATLGGSH